MKRIINIFTILSLCAMPAFGENQNTTFTFTVTGNIISDTNTNAVFIQEKTTECEFDNTKNFKSSLPEGNQTFEITCPANIEQITLDFQPKSMIDKDEVVLVESRTIILNANDTQYTFEDVTFSETATTPATTTTTDTTEHNTNTTSSCPACDDACKEKLHATEIYCDTEKEKWKPVTCKNGYKGYDTPTTVRGEDGNNITYYEICLSENAPECGYQEITDPESLASATCSHLCYQESYENECKLADEATIKDDNDPNNVIACLCNATEDQILAYKVSLSAVQEEEEEEDFPNLLQEAVVTADSPKTRIETLITQLANCIKEIETQ